MNRRKFSMAAATLLAALSATSVMPAAAQQDESSQPILTITGNIGEANRPALDEFNDAYLKFRDKNFSKAYEFTLPDVLALPQKTISAQAEKWPGPVELTGPSFADVLTAAGALAGPVTVTALDGYSITYTPEEIAAQEWILAWKANGKPLSIGGRGPLWLIHPSGATPAPDDVEARWIWSVFVIEVGQ
jgi:hypothetical protein